MKTKELENLPEEMALLKSASSRVLDDLQCPLCAESSVSVWFTKPEPDSYRTWFVCRLCDFKLRVQNDGQPVFFTESRRNSDLERYDSQLLEAAIFKRPPNM